MAKEKLAGHLAVGVAYVIFGLNLVFCKDIANIALVSPIVLFALRALGATALFWLISLFLPKEKIDPGDFWKIALASLLGLFLTQFTFLLGITMVSAIDAAILGTLGPIFTMIFAFILALYGIATMFELLEEVTVAFAPVVNSGSAVIAAAFIAGVIVYRRIRKKKNK